MNSSSAFSACRHARLRVFVRCLHVRIRTTLKLYILLNSYNLLVYTIAPISLYYFVILYRYDRVFDVRFSAMTWSFLLLLLKIITRINRRADVLYTRTTNVELVLEAFEPEWNGRRETDCVWFFFFSKSDISFRSDKTVMVKLCSKTVYKINFYDVKIVF